MSKFPVCTLHAIESEKYLCQHNKIPRNIQTTFRQEKPIRLEERTHLRQIGKCVCDICETRQRAICECMYNGDIKSKPQDNSIFVVDFRRKSVQKPKPLGKLLDGNRSNKRKKNHLVDKFRQGCRNSKQIWLKTKTQGSKISLDWIMKPRRKMNYSEMELPEGHSPADALRAGKLDRNAKKKNSTKTSASKKNKTSTRNPQNVTNSIMALGKQESSRTFFNKKIPINTIERFDKALEKNQTIKSKRKCRLNMKIAKDRLKGNIRLDAGEMPRFNIKLTKQNAYDVKSNEGIFKTLPNLKCSRLCGSNLATDMKSDMMGIVVKERNRNESPLDGQPELITNIYNQTNDNNNKKLFINKKELFKKSQPLNINDLKRFFEYRAARKHSTAAIKKICHTTHNMGPTDIKEPKRTQNKLSSGERKTTTKKAVPLAKLDLPNECKQKNSNHSKSISIDNNNEEEIIVNCQEPSPEIVDINLPEKEKFHDNANKAPPTPPPTIRRQKRSKYCIEFEPNLKQQLHWNKSRYENNMPQINSELMRFLHNTSDKNDNHKALQEKNLQRYKNPDVQRNNCKLQDSSGSKSSKLATHGTKLPKLVMEKEIHLENLLKKIIQKSKANSILYAIKEKPAKPFPQIICNYDQLQKKYKELKAARSLKRINITRQGNNVQKKLRLCSKILKEHNKQNQQQQEQVIKVATALEKLKPSADYNVGGKIFKIKSPFSVQQKYPMLNSTCYSKTIELLTNYKKPKPPFYINNIQKDLSKDPLRVLENVGVQTLSIKRKIQPNKNKA